ncbi:MAG TPA: glycosyltransferase [Solirubrobacteraceae bacterium]|nr:glycosyltransferase [Solirubrobacteraceae bacterium]
MRVLLVSAHGADPTYGGAERYVSNLADGLSPRGHDLEVLSAFPQPGEPRSKTYVLHDVDWREDRGRRLRNHLADVVSARWPRVEEIVREARPDVLHTNNLPGIGTGVWGVAKRLGVPVVHSLHDYHLLCPRTTLVRRDGEPCAPHPLLCGARTRRLMRWGDGVDVLIGVSGHMLRVHQGRFPAADQRVIPPPLVIPGSAPVRPPRTPPITLGYLGALTAIKGVELLLAAAPALTRAGLAVRIAGDGPLRAAVESARDVEYVGRLEGAELRAFVEECDAGVVPSLWDEPGPLVVGEWLSAARPVLATRRGGLADAARRGGIVVFDESPPALVDAARRLIAPGEWQRVLATIPRPPEGSDLERWLDQHEAAYRAAVGAAAAGDAGRWTPRA